MQYDDKRAYLRLQKCASTFTVRFLKQSGLCLQRVGQPHDNRLTNPEVHKICQTRWCFTIVRHPLDWLGSIWRFRTGAGWGTHQELDDCRHDTFDGFIENYLRLHPGFVSDLFQQFTGTANAPLVHYVGRSETVVDDLRMVCQLTDAHFREDLLPKERMNVSKQDRELSAYRRDLRDAVMEAERFAIARYKYDLWTDVR
jgi:hypothetical protein